MSEISGTQKIAEWSSLLKTIQCSKENVGWEVRQTLFKSWLNTSLLCGFRKMTWLLRGLSFFFDTALMIKEPTSCSVWGRGLSHDIIKIWVWCLEFSKQTNKVVGVLWLLPFIPLPLHHHHHHHIEGEQSFDTLKLPFGMLILSCYLRNKRLRKNFWPSPLFYLRDSDRKTCFRKETFGHRHRLSLIWIRYAKLEGFRKGPVGSVPHASEGFWVARQGFCQEVHSALLNYLEMAQSFWN